MNSATAQGAQFSFSHKSILSDAVNETGTLQTLFELIATPITQRKTKFVQVQNVTRNMYEGFLTEKQLKDSKAQLDRLKKDLGFYFTSGTNRKGHKAESLEYNGFIGFDLDFRFKGGDLVAKGLKEALKHFEFIPFLHLSSGGFGLKGLFKTDLKECDTGIYTFAEKQIFAYLASKGVNIEYDKHGYGKVCYFAYDKDAYLNLDASPFRIDIEAYEQEKAAKVEYQSNIIVSDDEVSAAVQFMIEHEVRIEPLYSKYLVFTTACKNTFGNEGASIAYSILDRNEGFSDCSFGRNFEQTFRNIKKTEIEGSYIVAIAKKSGFQYQYTTLSEHNTTHIQASQGEYLSDILQREGVAFTGEYFNNTKIVAPTGTGKGVMISKMQGKKVVVCPTNSLCLNYLKHGAITHTGVNFSKREEVLKADFIATTHANLPNLLSIIDPKCYHIAIDEAHNFTTSASKLFMLKDLKRTLRLSNDFATRSLWTGTDIYNFHSEFTAMKTIIVDIPKPKKQVQIIDAKSVVQSTIDRAKASIENGRFPIILLNNKKELLSQVNDGVKGLGFQVLNSDEKETAFFKELTTTGNIPSGVKGIITTSVIKEGNDIYNELDFDFILCNTHEAIFHSIEIEQLVNRARKPQSVNVFIVKSKNRKKVLDTFDPIEVMKTLRIHTENRVNELNNCNAKWLVYEKNAQFGNDYAFVENEQTGKFELCELLLSYKVFEAERRFELSNEAYQRTQLEKYSFVFSDTGTDDTAESEDIKAVFKTEREARKEQRHIDFEATKNDILEQIESGNKVVMPNTDTATDGKKFAVSCFERLTAIGIQPEKIFELIEDEAVKNEIDLGHLVKSVSFYQLANIGYMKENSLTAIRLQLITNSIEVGSKYSTSQLRVVMRRALNLEKGFNTRQFDKNTTSQQVLDFVRLFFKVKSNSKTKLWQVLGIQKYNTYSIEPQSILGYPNELKNNKLHKNIAFTFA